MKSYRYLFALGLLIPALIAGSLLLVMMGRPTQLPSLFKEVPLSLSQAKGIDDSTTFDSRPCAAHASADNCNGVLPFGPHFSVSSREQGSGFCFNDKPTTVEDQPVTDNGGKVVGDFQLWYLPSCQTYTSHLIINMSNLPTVTASVQQFDGSGFWNGVTQVMWHLGDQDPLLPSATQVTGPLQDSDVWSPMLYSPTAPVQASANIDGSGISSAAISSYYTAGTPTTINGKSV